MNAIQTEVSDGSLVSINVGLEYFEQSDISVFLDQSTTPLVDGTDYQWANATRIDFLAGPIANGVTVTLVRNTQNEQMLNIYDGGAPFTRYTLDENFLQLLRLSQEFSEGLGLTGLRQALDMHGYRIFNLGDPENPADAATKKYIDDLIAFLVESGTGPIGAATNVAYVNGDGVPTDLQNASLRQIDSVKQLFGMTGAVGGEKADMSGYHPGTRIGGGRLVWAPAVPRSQHDGFLIFSPTVPSASMTTSQASIISYMNKTGETSPGANGCWIRLEDGPAHMEWGGVTAGVDCGLLAQRLIDACVPTGRTLNCNVVLTLGTGLTMPQYRDTPPVSRQFDHSCVYLRSVVYTAASGNALFFNTSGADLEIGELNGPGPSAGITRGVRLSGQGAGRVKVNFIQGFQNGVHLEEAYAHSVTVGWIDNCIRGVAFVNANDNRVTGGRVGGRYSTAAIDSTTCEIGVEVGAGCASNRINMNIEYCRRSVNSIGLRDSGTGTQFSGYIESCTAWNVYADGRNARINVLPGGSVQRADTAGFYAGDTNVIDFEANQDYHNEVPSADKNTLAFSNLQSIASSGTGKIVGRSGLTTYPRQSGSASNQLLFSNTLNNSSNWSFTATGGASTAGVMSTVTTALPELGLPISTQFVLPPLAADDAEYIVSQTVSVAAGPLSFGLYALCTSGEVDVYVRVIKSDATVQHRIVAHLSGVAGSNWVRIGSELLNSFTDASATYQIRLRSAPGCTVLISNTYVVNRVDAGDPAVNWTAVRRTIYAGKVVDGKSFPNGVMINGPLQSEYKIVNGTTTLNLARWLDFRTLYCTGAGYNVTIGPGNDGQEIAIKKDGATGTVGVLLSGVTVDGSSAGITLNPLDVLRLQYVPTTGWIKL